MKKSKRGKRRWYPNEAFIGKRHDERECSWLYITPAAWALYSKTRKATTPVNTPIVVYYSDLGCWGASYNNWGGWIWGFETREEAQKFAQHRNFLTIMRIREATDGHT